MKRMFIATLVVLALGVAGCAAGTSSGDFVDGAGIEMPDGDMDSPFEIEPTDEAYDDVEVEAEDGGDDDVIVEEEGSEKVELLTDIDDIDIHAEFGEGSSYSQLFEVANYGAEYEWDVDGLPAGTGLALVEVTGSGSKVRLEGEPTGLDLGTHQITVMVWDAADPSNEDSISFALEVVSVYEPQSVIEDLPKGPCGEPLTVEVVKLGNYSDPDILQAGEATYEIGEIVEIEVRARRGDGLPVGKVKWEVSSEVEDSEHCFFGIDNVNADGNLMPLDYNYSWVRDGFCAFGMIGVEAVDDDVKEVRKTTNPFWQTRELRDASLKIAGIFSYDGPLPVRNLPLDTNAVERLRIVAKDECGYSEDSRLDEGNKTFKFGIAYPDAVGSDGGNMTDIKAHLKYSDVTEYASGIGPWGSGFSVVFTDSNGLSNHALDDAEVGLLATAYLESVGWIHYSFNSCAQGHENCDKKMVINGSAKSSVLDASRVYMLWVSPAKIIHLASGTITQYADINIQSIAFKNKYWDAKFTDGNDDFNKNIVTDFTRLDRLWQFDGMSERAYRYSDNSNVRVIFRRNELAGWAPLPNQ